MTPTPVKSFGKRGRQTHALVILRERRPTITVSVADALKSQNYKDQYTPEYWQAKEQVAYTANNGEFYEGELQEYRDKVEAEAEVSRLARDRGYTPGRMTQADWYHLANELRGEAEEDLRYATEGQREAAGNKAVNRRIRRAGDSREFIQVGGQAVERKWTGGSATAARKATARINRETKQQAAAYMTGKLVQYGYKRETVKGLSYTQKRRLVAEIGHGELQKNNIGKVPKAERRRVVEAASNKEQLAARSIAINPRAAIGLDTWDQYEMAMVKAGRENEIEPPPRVEEKNTPNYVKYAGSRKPERRQPFVAPKPKPVDELGFDDDFIDF